MCGADCWYDIIRYDFEQYCQIMNNWWADEDFQSIQL